MIMQLSLLFLVGIQLITLSLFVINYYFGIKLTPHISLGLAGSLIILLLFVFRRRCFGTAITPDFSKWRPRERLMAGILVLIIIAPLLWSFRTTVTSWDAITLFDYRAKVILDTGYINDTLDRASVSGYPLFTSLAHWFLYSIGLSTPMPLYPLLLGSFLIVGYSLLRQLATRSLALLGIMFLAITPKLFDQSLVAYSNMPYSVYLILGAVYIYFWTRNRRKSYLIIGILFSLMSLWVRSFPFLIIQLGLALIYAKVNTKVKFAFILFVVLFGSKYLPPLDVNRLLGVFEFLKWSTFQYYFSYWLLFGFTLFYWYKSASREIFWPLLIIGYTLLLYLGTYIYSFQDPNYTIIPDTIQRTGMFINVAISWFALTAIYETLHQRKNSG